MGEEETIEPIRDGEAVQPSSNRRTPWLRFLLDVLETIVISALLFLGINTVTARIRVDSYSMEPTLTRGSLVMVNKFAYKFGAPQRGDVIVFHYPPNPEQQYIKRVIGLPGEQVKIANGKVYINGVMLEEPYIQAPIQRGGEWQVPANALFVLGDNRNNSADSRVWGMVPMDYVIGKALFVYWPPEKWGLLGYQFARAAEP
jgi:signal peptidase I